MQIKKKLLSLRDKLVQKKIFLKLSLIFNFVWAVCKIIFGVFTFSYFFCVSGASTILFGFVKKVYIKYFNSNDYDEKRTKSIIISVLLIFSSVLFTFYMARLFFIKQTNEYGLIVSILIAAVSFTELILSIYNFIKSKKSTDVLLKSFKGCSLVSSCYAMAITQIALLSATDNQSNFYNGITGVIFGCIAIIIGLYLLIIAMKDSNTNFQM